MPDRKEATAKQQSRVAQKRYVDLSPAQKRIYDREAQRRSREKRVEQYREYQRLYMRERARLARIKAGKPKVTDLLDEPTKL